MTKPLWVLAGVCWLLHAAPVSTQTRLMDPPAVVRDVQLETTNGKRAVQFWIVPAEVQFRNESVLGVFTIITDPATKRLWWAFRNSRALPGSPLEAASTFQATHVAYPTPEALVVFSSSTAELLIGVGDAYYASPESVPSSVRAQFDSRAANLSSSGFGVGGYHYFEKAVDVWDAVGLDFFVDTSSSKMRVEPIPIESVARLDGGWSVMIRGRIPDHRAVVTLTDDFKVKAVERLQ